MKSKIDPKIRLLIVTPNLCAPYHHVVFDQFVSLWKGIDLSSCFRFLPLLSTALCDIRLFLTSIQLFPPSLQSKMITTVFPRHTRKNIIFYPNSVQNGCIALEAKG